MVCDLQWIADLLRCCPASSSSKFRTVLYQQCVHAPWLSMPALNWYQHIAHTLRNTNNNISRIGVLLCISLCYQKHIHEHLMQQKQGYLCSSRIEFTVLLGVWEPREPHSYRPERDGQTLKQAGTGLLVWGLAEHSVPMIHLLESIQFFSAINTIMPPC